MPFRAVLDTNVLFPFSLRDTLLRLAEPAPGDRPVPLYVPLWSGRILQEMERKLVEGGRMDQERSTYLTSAMKSAFEEAAVPEKAIDALEDSMTNDPDDRHVLAAAVAGRADTIVTFNLRHFPPDACARFGVEALHPDDFLLALYGATPDEVVATVKQQAADLKSPPWTLEELIGALARAGVERFAETLRPHAL